MTAAQLQDFGDVQTTDPVVGTGSVGTLTYQTSLSPRAQESK
jgi:hypothetical protein